METVLLLTTYTKAGECHDGTDQITTVNGQL